MDAASPPDGRPTQKSTKITTEAQRHGEKNKKTLCLRVSVVHSCLVLARPGPRQLLFAKSLVQIGFLFFGQVRADQRSHFAFQFILQLIHGGAAGQQEEG